MRAAMRNAVTAIPAHQWVCDDGLVAFFTIIATHSRSVNGRDIIKETAYEEAQFAWSYYCSRVAQCRARLNSTVPPELG
jgi:hypothetical protein